ncbi:DUF47 domain-containing protein [Buchananella hordeovulneris]|nr:DUF47 family protein [Buchananella hordeovulneris]
MTVRLRPTPTNGHLFDLYAKVAQSLVAASQSLTSLVATVDRQERKEHLKTLHDAEHAADEAIHEVFTRMNSTFVTPLDRDDLAELAATLDDCVDEIDEAGDLIYLYKLGELPSDLVEMVEIIAQCAALTNDAIPRLRDLQSLKEYWLEINRLENAGDKLYRHMLASLFETEPDPIQIIKLKDVTKSLESAIDHFEVLAHVIETIAVKEA